MTKTIRPVGPDIWVGKQPARVFGIEYGIRMTVVRLADGRLVILSPVSFNTALAKAIDSLGKVAFLITPNSFHHLHMKPWTEHYAQAKLMVVPHVRKKRPDLNPQVIIDQQTVNQPPAGGDPLADFRNELPAIFVACGGMYEEVMFFHKASRTIILTDLCFNIQHAHGWFAKCALKLYGIYKKFGPSKAVALFIKNREQVAQAVAKIHDWQYQRVIVAHGDIVENAPPTLVQDALAKLVK